MEYRNASSSIGLVTTQLEVARTYVSRAGSVTTQTANKGVKTLVRFFINGL